MASLFTRSEPDDELCVKYAQFASHMVRWQFKIIYWSMFVTNLLVLFFASWTYTRGQEALERYNHNLRIRSKRLRQSMLMCMGCVMVSTAIVIMEAYALMALQFCDGEDLMSLYWSTWTMIQVGSLIAMVGIILALAHSLRNRQHPPWALALGTPVLVIAGFLHLFHDCTKKRVRKKMNRNKLDLEGITVGPPMSQANTISVNPDDEIDTNNDLQGQVVGLTFDGGPIIRFTDSVPDTLPEHAQLLGWSENNKPIVMYQRNSIQFLTESSENLAPPATPDCRKNSSSG